jgi:hypothetical protein
MMSRILREPLLHFTVLGAGLFLLYGLSSERVAGAPGRIVVTLGQVEHLAAGFERTWHRAPTDEELAGLVGDRVREEVYVREALALGLDQEDVVIRRRLRQKMEFIADDVGSGVEPTDGELEAFLLAQADSFTIAPRLTFEQLYLNPDTRGANLARDATELLAELNAADDAVNAAGLGDALLLERRFADSSSDEISALFGADFAAALARVEPGRWQGPIRSGFGEHLVLIIARTAPRQPELSEVRESVRRAWNDARRQAANEAFYRRLLERYSVTIEGSEQQPRRSGLIRDETR